MAKPFSLQTLLDLSQLRMDEAGRRLSDLLAGEKAASNRALLLQQYRDEYQARFVLARQSGITRDALDNYQSFLRRLDEAVGQARELAEQSGRLAAAGKREWLDQRSQVRAFDTLSQRQQEQEQRFDNRLEQKAQDEYAARGRHKEDR